MIDVKKSTTSFSFYLLKGKLIFSIFIFLSVQPLMNGAQSSSDTPSDSVDGGAVPSDPSDAPPDLGEIPDLDSLPDVGELDFKITSDFNKDNNGDVLWQNQIEGDAFKGFTVLWYLNENGQFVSDSVVGNVPGWNLSGKGDFNGDGHQDVIWQNQISGDPFEGWAVVWFLENGAYIGDAPLGVVPGWTVAATGDFNSDGKDDIVWQNQISGDPFEGFAVVWFLDGVTFQSDAPIGLVPGWKLVGAGDFDSDGKDDVVWQNQVSGDPFEGFAVVWFLDGANYQSDTGIGVVPGWEIAGVSDYNRDFKADVIWQNRIEGDSSEGFAVVWYLEDGVYCGDTAVGIVPGWSIVGN